MRILAANPAAAVLGVAALFFMCAAALTAVVAELRIHNQVASILTANGHEWVDVDVNGLQVRLSGTATDEATRFNALKLAGTVVNAARVVDAMAVDSVDPIKVPRFSIEILRNNDGVSLIGLVPAAMDRSTMRSAIRFLAGNVEVTDLLDEADYPIPEGLEQAVEFGFVALAKLPKSKISVTAGQVEITATLARADEKRRVENDLLRRVPEDIELALRISSPRPVIAPFTLRFLIDENGVRFDACSAHTEAGRERILAAAIKAGLTGDAECRLGLGLPSPDWPEAAVAAIEALDKVGSGAVTLSDASVSLVAPSTTSHESFNVAARDLEAALPDIFSLDAVRLDPVIRDELSDGDGPPEFLATKSPEGLLQLRGRVTDAWLREAVEGYALAYFPGIEVLPAMRLDQSLPDGWAGRIFAGLEALSLLSYGFVIVQPEFLDLRGTSGDPDAKADASRILSTQLGPGENFAIKIVHREPPRLQNDLPSPQECVDSINAILAKNKVVFAPGSGEIEAVSLSTINRIAKLLVDCSDVPMEIAGHTDSQGRESMNLELSQHRAEAVLVALQSRRILTGNLTPVGYGESEPIEDNDTEEGREANRRIEFRLILPEESQQNEEEAAEVESTDG